MSQLNLATDFRELFIALGQHETEPSQRHEEKPKLEETHEGTKHRVEGSWSTGCCSCILCRMITPRSHLCVPNKALVYAQVCTDTEVKIAWNHVYMCAFRIICVNEEKFVFSAVRERLYVAIDLLCGHL